MGPNPISASSSVTNLALIPLYIGILAFMAVAALWRGAPYAFQVWVVILLMYSLALLNLVTEGRGSLGRVFLLVAAFSANLFLGRRAIVPSLVVVVLTMAGFGHGLLTIYANHDQSVNQLLPPLTIEADEVAQVLETLDRMLTWLGEVT